MARKWGKVSPKVLPDFEGLRHQPPQVLLAALHRRLVLELAGRVGVHYEGLAQAARDARSVIGAPLVAKMKMIDEAFHLMRHISPESCTICFAELVAALEGPVESDSTRKGDEKRFESDSSSDSSRKGCEEEGFDKEAAGGSVDLGAEKWADSKCDGVCQFFIGDEEGVVADASTQTCGASFPARRPEAAPCDALAGDGAGEENIHSKLGGVCDGPSVDEVCIGVSFGPRQVATRVAVVGVLPMAFLPARPAVRDVGTVTSKPKRAASAVQTVESGGGCVEMCSELGRWAAAQTQADELRGCCEFAEGNVADVFVRPGGDAAVETFAVRGGLEFAEGDAAGVTLDQSAGVWPRIAAGGRWADAYERELDRGAAAAPAVSHVKAGRRSEAAKAVAVEKQAASARQQVNSKQAKAAVDDRQSAAEASKVQGAEKRASNGEYQLQAAQKEVAQAKASERIGDTKAIDTGENCRGGTLACAGHGPDDAAARSHVEVAAFVHSKENVAECGSCSDSSAERDVGEELVGSAGVLDVFSLFRVQIAEAQRLLQTPSGTIESSFPAARSHQSASSFQGAFRGDELETTCYQCSYRLSAAFFTGPQGRSAKPRCRYCTGYWFGFVKDDAAEKRDDAAAGTAVEQLHG
jgi:hypothetical protein